jgi:YD repeat-containing protein
MSRRYTCPQGHQWEEPDLPGAEEAAPSCPVCASQFDTPPLLGADSARLKQLLTALHEDPPSPPAPTALPQVPGYEILEELGRGGMGVVYKARHLKLDRVVAMKMILQGSGAELARFLTEARAIARVTHPHIVQVFEVGEHDGRPFLALEFCAGGSLARQLNGAPLPPKQAAELVESLANAMHAAHQANVIHRDLKPANVLLAFLPSPSASGGEGLGVRGVSSGEFTSKISDFGLAKKLDEPGLTQSGAIVGTPAYMAPEQVQASKDVGPAADVWALGAILYECLTGQPPFQGPNSAETMLLVLSQEPQPPRRSHPNVPRDLETICLKCLRKDPRSRYESAAALAADLRAFLEGRPIQARSVPFWERVGKWARRRPASASALVAAVVLLFVALAGGLWYWHTYQRITIEYYRSVTRRNGVLEGIDRIDDPLVRRRRNSTRKLYRRAGRVFKVETVNGHDHPAPGFARTMIAGVEARDPEQGQCSIEYRCKDNGEVVEQIARNRSGKVVYRLHYTSPTTAHFSDDKGYLRPGRGSDAVYVRIDRTPDGLEREHHFLDSRGRAHPTSQGVYGRRIEHDKRGRVITETFLDKNGNPVCCNDGYASQTTEFDEEGNPRTVAFSGVDGKPARHKDGYAKIEVDCDDYGNFVKITWLDLDGKPTRNKQGIAILKAEYDDWGNQFKVACFDPAGKPTLHKDGYHRRKTVFDERGHRLEETWFGTDGMPTLIGAGYHTMQARYERGHQIAVGFFDRDGKPTLNKDGYARLEADYDEDGNLIEVRRFGTNGKPTLTKQGIHRIKSRYDERGNNIDTRFFDLDGKTPILHKDGNARRTRRYDDRGYLIEERHFGLDGKPTLIKTGVHRTTFHYDERGNQDEGAYFGIDDKPTLSKKGMAGWKSRFDERGNLIEQSYFGIDGKPILHKDGDARVTKRYDDRGKLIEERYFGIDGKPTLINTGFHRLALHYDERGQRDEEAYFGVDDKPILSKLGVARQKLRRDEWGNIVEQRYFGIDGKSTAHAEGNFSVTRKYDERGNLVEQAWFDRDGKPTPLKGGAHAKAVFAYDERGNRTSESYFGPNGKPVLREGVAKHVLKYDERGNNIEQWYLGLDGKPIAHVQGYFGLTWKFDARGNKIQTDYHDANGRLMRAKSGYAQVRFAYDDRGNMIERILHGPDGKPASDPNGVTRTTWKYDDRDNQIEEAIFGPDGKPQPIGDGYSRLVARYDARDRRVQITLHGYDGRSGFVAIAEEDNESGKPVKEIYLDASGKPVRHTRLGYARVLSTFDATGRKWLRSEHFDEAGRPVATQVVIFRLVPGGQAEKIGLRVNDVLLAYDGTAVRGGGARWFKATGNAKQISVRFRREGKEETRFVSPGPLGVFLEDRAAPR